VLSAIFVIAVLLKFFSLNIGATPFTTAAILRESGKTCKYVGLRMPRLSDLIAALVN